MCIIMLDFYVGAERLTIDMLYLKKHVHAGWGRAINREKGANFASVTSLHPEIEGVWL